MMKELIEEALEEGGVEGGRRNIQDTEALEGIKLQVELRSEKYC